MPRPKSADANRINAVCELSLGAAGTTAAEREAARAALSGFRATFCSGGSFDPR